MTGEQEIRLALDDLQVPGLERTIGSLNMVRSVTCSGGNISLELAQLWLNDLAQNLLRIQAGKRIKSLPDVKKVEVAYVKSKPSELNEIRHVIAVMSGKGGVGKSLVSGLIASELKRRGFSVGVLDADITGPSVPRMFGLKEKPGGCAEGILPVLTPSGIAVMSVNLVLENEDDAVVWRGPIIANTITQFWEECFWGKLDYLIVDLPPGTSDAPLTVIQKLPVSGLVIVSTPQELASMIVKKAVSMARMTNCRILGVVENMSYLYLEDSKQRLEVFGPGRGKELAQASGAPLLAEIPIDPKLAKLCDEGRIEEYQSDIGKQLVDVLLDSMSGKQEEGDSDGGKQ
jgi:ATP-binding protein involved in chromosome partitioning